MLVEAPYFQQKDTLPRLFSLIVGKKSFHQVSPVICWYKVCQWEMEAA